MILEEETLNRYGHSPFLLGKTSTKMCVLKCDYCGENFEKTIREVNRGRKKTQKDACKKKECVNLKQKEVYGSVTSKKKTQIQKKREKTCLDRFGVNNAAKNKSKQLKTKAKMIERYGVEYALQDKSFQDKKRNTMLSRYGSLDNLSASGRKEEIIESLKSKALETTTKGVKTSIERYGVKNVSLLESTKIKREETVRRKYGVGHVSELQRIPYSSIAESCKAKGYKPLFKEEDYKGYRQGLEFKCLKHRLVFGSCVENLLRDVKNCPKCKANFVSRTQKEIFNFVKSEESSTVYLSNRSALRGTELDIYIPSKKFAIEYHGLYWHSSINIESEHHKSKFLKAKNADIDLFQVFEDEWRDKKDICKSIIRQKLGIQKNKLFARKLNLVKNIPSKEVQGFLEKNHFQGRCSNPTFSVGLQDSMGNLIFVMTSRDLMSNSHSDNNKLEVTRVCSLADTVITGGFSRCLKRIIKFAVNEGYTSIVSYSDCMYSGGDVYRKHGFKKISHSPPNYYYTDFVNRYKKYGYRAKKGKSEPEIVAELGLHKIYNAGTIRWELEL